MARVFFFLIVKHQKIQSILIEKEHFMTLKTESKQLTRAAIKAALTALYFGILAMAPSGVVVAKEITIGTKVSDTCGSGWRNCTLFVSHTATRATSWFGWGGDFDEASRRAQIEARTDALFLGLPDGTSSFSDEGIVVRLYDPVGSQSYAPSDYVVSCEGASKSVKTQSTTSVAFQTFIRVAIPDNASCNLEVHIDDGSGGIATVELGADDLPLLFQTTLSRSADIYTITNATIGGTLPAPITIATAPTSLVATPSDGQVSVAFTAPTDDGGATITDYEYQLGSEAWTSAGVTTTPVVITGLANGTAYSIKLRAVNSTGNGIESAAASVTPATTTNAPTALVATAGDGQVSIAFTAPSNNGGAAITDYEYELDDSGTWTSASTAATPVVITGLANGTAYSIKLRAVNSTGNGIESAAVNVLLGSPASEFAAKEDAIRSVITDDAQRSLRSTIASNRNLSQAARQRFVEQNRRAQGCKERDLSAEELDDDNIDCTADQKPFDIDGTAVASADLIATQGTFFAQTGNFEGTQRRLVFGDFDVQRDGDTGSTTATINGKVAWEQMLSEQTMLGYYLGGEVARSNIKGSFTGTKDAYGVSVGGYFVHALQENLFLDGFASLGAGRNDLEMADDTLALTSNYTTQTATLGAAISGIIEQAGYDILPELSVAYGRTTIGNVGFTGVAYDLTDDTLSLDAGSVSTATIMFRPEVRVPMDGLAASESRSVFSFAPRVMCERVKVASTTDNCGSGAELGISSSTQDGLTLVNTTIIADRVGNSTRSSLQFNLQHKF